MPTPTYSDFVRYGQEAEAAARVAGLVGFHNGPADAFRHAYASAEMTREFGEGWARVLGDANELKEPGHLFGPEGNMDLWNNARGREIGRESTSRQDTIQRVIDALQLGELIARLDDSRNRYYDDYGSAHSGLPGTWGIEGWDSVAPGAAVADNWSNALTFTPRRDPLVIDLDADGLELRAADGNVLFDHNADGIRTGTGWVLPDDALLVWDRNANGTIDSGRELFGVDTIKANGLLATDGFDALRDLDSNGDGLFSAADAQFAALRLWRDLDQDGVADAGELGTLAAANIASISLQPTPSGALINNNRVDSTAVVARTGGLAPTTAGAIDFAENTFAREFTGSTVGGTVVLTPTAQALPQMRGSGMVRDLREAMIQKTGRRLIQTRLAMQKSHYA